MNKIAISKLKMSVQLTCISLESTINLLQMFPQISCTPNFAEKFLAKSAAYIRWFLCYFNFTCVNHNHRAGASVLVKGKERQYVSGLPLFF